MNNTIRINNHNIALKEYKRQRVITFEDMDTVHERPDGTAKRNFNKNQKRFIENEDYFFLTFEEARSTNFVPRPNSQGHILITESGYLMLVKSFTDDLAWEVQRQLVKTYFRAKEILKQYQSDPQWQEARQKNKVNRLRETDEVKRYVAYCKEHGSTHADGYYVKLTSLVNKAVDISARRRDKINYEVLQIITILENTIRHTIADELKKQTEYHAIYYVCKERVKSTMTYIYLPEQRLLTAI